MRVTRQSERYPVFEFTLPGQVRSQGPESAHTGARERTQLVTTKASSRVCRVMSGNVKGRSTGARQRTQLATAKASWNYSPIYELNWEVYMAPCCPGGALWTTEHAPIVGKKGGQI